MSRDRAWTHGDMLMVCAVLSGESRMTMACRAFNWPFDLADSVTTCHDMHSDVTFCVRDDRSSGGYGGCSCLELASMVAAAVGKAEKSKCSSEAGSFCPRQDDASGRR